MTAPDNFDSVLKQQTLIQEIAASMPAEMTNDWVQLELVARCTRLYAEYDLYSLGPDEKVNKQKQPPSGIPRMLDELRALMYEEGKGTWLSCRWVLTRNPETGNADLATNFNFDEKVNFDDDVSPAYFVDDLKRFPREEHITPLWLKTEVKRGLKDLESGKL